MEEDRESAKFSIRLNEDDQEDDQENDLENDREKPDFILRAERDNLQIKKLNRRITLVYIIIPFLIVMILFFAYTDIKKRSAQIQDLSATEVEKLSKNIELKFSSLSARQEKLESVFEKKTTSMEKSSSLLKADLKKANDVIKKIKSSKADKKNLERSLDKIDKTIAPIRKDFKNISSKIKSNEKKITDRLAGLSESIDKTEKLLNKLQKDITAIASAKIDKKMLETEQNIYQKKLDKMEMKSKDELKSILKKIKELSKKIEMSDKITTSKPQKLKPQKVKPTKLKSGTLNNQTTDQQIPQPGKIIEQDIQ